MKADVTAGMILAVLSSFALHMKQIWVETNFILGIVFQARAE